MYRDPRLAYADRWRPRLPDAALTRRGGKTNVVNEFIRQIKAIQSDEQQPSVTAYAAKRRLADIRAAADAAFGPPPARLYNVL